MVASGAEEALVAADLVLDAENEVGTPASWSSDLIHLLRVDLEMDL
jgi:hypothetical protein